MKTLEEDVWRKFDSDHDGELTLEEARPAVKFILARIRGKYNQSFSEKRYKQLFKEFDVDNSGTIDKAEMTPFIKKLICHNHDGSNKSSAMSLDQKLEQLEKECWKRFDINGDCELNIDQARMAINFIV